MGGVWKSNMGKIGTNVIEQQFFKKEFLYLNQNAIPLTSPGFGMDPIVFHNRQPGK